MKDKILYLILGFLIGAILTTVVFLVFPRNNRGEMGGERPGRQPQGNMINMIPDGDFRRNAK